MRASVHVSTREPTAGELDESALRMRLRHELAATFHDEHHASCIHGWRWLGRTLRRGGVVAPVDLTLEELERALAELQKLVAERGERQRAEARAA